MRKSNVPAGTKAHLALLLRDGVTDSYRDHLKLKHHVVNLLHGKSLRHTVHHEGTQQEVKSMAEHWHCPWRNAECKEAKEKSEAEPGKIVLNKKTFMHNVFAYVLFRRTQHLVNSMTQQQPGYSTTRNAVNLSTKLEDMDT